ncbi:protein of unknown function [Cupriavidus taiwanensis]|nr:protein of unknown function [Cupriavidus taiwanensis]
MALGGKAVEHHANGVPVRLAARDLGRANGAAGAGAVVDDHRLVQALAQALLRLARDLVDHAAGGKRHDQRDRLGWPVLARGRRGGQGQRQGSQRREQPPDARHWRRRQRDHETLLAYSCRLHLLHLALHCLVLWRAHCTYCFLSKDERPLFADPIIWAAAAGDKTFALPNAFAAKAKILARFAAKPASAKVKVRPLIKLKDATSPVQNR